MIMRFRPVSIFYAVVFVLCLARETAWAEGFVPLDPGMTLTRFAFGSCMDEELAQPVWPSVFEFNPQLFIFTGDNVYGDSRAGWPLNLNNDLTPLVQSYDMMAARPDFQRLKSTVPILATWDDHDYGRRDAGADFPMRVDSEKLFRDFWRLDPKTTPPLGQGLYQSRVIGPEGRRVQFILLDTRSFRAPLKKASSRQRMLGKRYVPDPDPAKTMLGDVQWAWLEQQLKRPAELRFIVSSIQVLSDGHQFERWGNLPLELERLFETVRGASASGVVLLSGDMHRASLHRAVRQGLYPIFEVTSSPFTKPIPDDDGGSSALASPFGEVNFGAVMIDWELRSLTVQLRDQDGKSVQQIAIAFAELSMGETAEPDTPE